MESKVSPNSGQPDDEETTLDFPSEGNFSYQAYPPESINREPQSGYYLTGQHIVYPVSLAQPSDPPAELPSPPPRSKQTRQKQVRILPPTSVLIVLLTIIWFGLSQVGNRLTSLFNPSAPAELNMQIPVTGQLGKLPQPQRNEAPLAKNNLTSRQFVPLISGDCSLPPDWEPYTVQPNDSIFRISVLRNVSREELLNANCLGSQAVLTPGTTLYVPVQNPAVIATTIPQPTLPHWANYVNDPGAGDSSSENDNNPTPLPPSAVPPTQAPVVVPDDPTSAPPTAAPPAQAPVVVQNKPDPTKEKKDQPANVSPPPDEKKDKGTKNNKDDNKDDKGGKKGKGGK